ncbi:MAG: hypothetical protein ABI611_19180, partial [Solirubrobacteraceae bacterium]
VLALRYYERSKRTQLVAEWREAEALGGSALQDAFVRWGRGMSFHEFELIFDDLPRHVVRGGWEPELLGEREIYREELALQRILDTARPDLPPAFSRYWLDIILTARPAERPPPHVRPWRLETSSSAQAGVVYSDTEVVLLNSSDSTLVVVLPSPSRRLVITAGGTDRDVALTVHQPAHGISLEGSARGNDRPLDLNFPQPANRYEIRAAEPTTVSFVGYVA